MIHIRVVGDQETAAKFKKAAEKAPRTIEKAMQRITLFLARYVKQNKLTGQVLKVRTGRLRNSIATEVKQNGINTVGRVGTDVIYARIHEFGGNIYPRKARWLHFQVNGQWVMTKHVKIPKRPYMGPSIAENKDRIVRELGNAYAAMVK